jgi:hypothetical protein
VWGGREERRGREGEDMETSFSTDKLKPEGQNLDQVFNSRCGRACAFHIVTLLTKTTQLKDENSAQKTFRLSPVTFSDARFFYL